MQADGSFMAEVPADTPLGFEALNQEGEILRRVEPLFRVQPGENRSCIGCHAAHNRAPHNHRPLAVNTAVACLRVEPGPGRPKRRDEMKPSRILIRVGIVVLMSTVSILGHHYGGNAHIRKRIGQPPLAKATCFNCHFVSTDRLLWAKPRPHHDSPAGLAVSHDGKRLYISLDNRDEVAEADIATRKVLRRARVPGGPFGLALDASGKRLFVTCRQADRLALLDTGTLKETGSLPVGMGPAAVAFCRTAAGDRLIVANAMSDDVSVISLAPLKELARPAAGREPFAVAATSDGARAFVANRLVGLSSIKTMPASEVTVIDPATARVIRRDALESAHLSEGVGLDESRSWALTPLVKVRNMVPITQVAGGWVMSSGLAISDIQAGRRRPNSPGRGQRLFRRSFRRGG